MSSEANTPAQRLPISNPKSGPWTDDPYVYYIENGIEIGRFEHEARGWLMQHPEYQGCVYRDGIGGDYMGEGATGDCTGLFFNMEDE